MEEAKQKLGQITVKRREKPKAKSQNKTSNQEPTRRNIY
jgi:hypothetical protein